MEDERSFLIKDYDSKGYENEENVIWGRTGREEAVTGNIKWKTRFYVYLSHFLSAWGDRMWSFGVGLYMIELEPQDLRLVAIFGFASGGATLFMGAIVGDWVDTSERMTAARWSLVIQNISVCVCSVIVYFVFLYHGEVKDLWPQEGFAILSYAVIIIIAIISNLASVARTIAVERDWIVEICGRDSELLADMTSKLRAIDQTTLIIAPIATGQIIAFTEIGYGALFIAGWNVVSVVIEYYLIWKVYDVVPALKKKKKLEIKAKENDTEQSKLLDEIHASSEVIEKSNFINKIFSSFITLKRGWKTYMKYDVAFAGLGLAMLYMTVLGFDNITVGYSYSQGISESFLGIIMATGAFFGITASFFYPRIRRCIGLQRTGLLGLGSQILLLSLCVVAVWAPGSPFDLFFTSRSSDDAFIPVSNITVLKNTTERLLSVVNETSARVSSTQNSYASIGLLLAGIVGARFGLYTADLTITQLFLQSVVEKERGITNGVQSSLNQMMDTLKFLMVILAPQEELFGLLILISFVFVCIGWVFYAKYSRSVRGHLCHIGSICNCNAT